MLPYIKLDAFHFYLINVSVKIKVRETQLSAEQNESIDCLHPKCHTVCGRLFCHVVSLSHFYSLLEMKS